jgi:hypothetical protein
MEDISPTLAGSHRMNGVALFSQNSHDAGDGWYGHSNSSCKSWRGILTSLDKTEYLFDAIMDI